MLASAGMIGRVGASRLGSYGLPALRLPFDVTRILSLLPDDANTGTTAGAAPTYTYSIADEADWDGNSRSKLLVDKAQAFLAEGPGSTVNAQSCRDWLATFAAVSGTGGPGIMRLNASTTYVDGTISNYYAARNWAANMYVWAYLYTKDSTVYSDADRAAIETMIAGWLSDVRYYYAPATDTLGSKLNNHLGWALLLAALCAIATNDREGLAWVQAGRQTVRTRSVSDPLKEDAAPRPLWGYDPDASNPLPERALSMMDLDRAAGTTLHNGFYYSTWHTACAAVTDMLLDANGYNELTRTDGNFDWASAVAAYDAICADDGAALWAFIDANDVDNTATSSSHLQVSTYKVHADIAGLRFLTAKGFPSATIDTNLASKTNRLFGGDIDYLRGFL